MVYGFNLFGDAIEERTIMGDAWEGDAWGQSISPVNATWLFWWLHSLLFLALGQVRLDYRSLTGYNLAVYPPSGLNL